MLSQRAPHLMTLEPIQRASRPFVLADSHGHFADSGRKGNVFSNDYNGPLACQSTAGANGGHMFTGLMSFLGTQIPLDTQSGFGIYTGKISYCRVISRFFPPWDNGPKSQFLVRDLLNNIAGQCRNLTKRYNLLNGVSPVF